jgi:molybdate transport system substrate-binding protein
MLKKWLGRWLSVALLFSIGAAQAQEKELLIYCGITMVRPITELARQFEQAEKVRVTISQGGSEDLYQSAKRSRLGDIYFPGEPSYRARHLAEGLLGYHKLVGYNQVAIIVPKGNPKQVKPDLQELLRKDLVFILGNAESGSIGQEGKRGEGDVALNWRATAFFPDNAPHLDVVDLDTRIAEPQALLLIQLNFSKHPLLAQKFIDFAASPEGQAVFRKYGFLDNRTR